MITARCEPLAVGKCIIKTSMTSLALLTDLYELTMAQAYLEEGLTDQAVFSLFVRRLPTHRNFLIACGLETVLDSLETLRFSDDDLEYLASLRQFSPKFLDWLKQMRFTGDVYAVPEGTPVFAHEPIIEVVAPLPIAQLVETLVMNQIHLQTLLASKAYRVVAAAKGRPVFDFAARRMHGSDAALKGARAFYIAGVAATSNVLAGKLYRIPVVGTMAHSYIQAHRDEIEAFRAFTRHLPGDRAACGYIRYAGRGAARDRAGPARWGRPSASKPYGSTPESSRSCPHARGSSWIGPGCPMSRSWPVAA
jgi:nicotinate phosphoribosyltransferase